MGRRRQERSLAPTVSYTAIAEAFDDPAILGRLLILGAPGSGKTTALLQLAEHLIARAQLDLDKPIPVLLNLSSWTHEKGTLDDWLVHEIKMKYGVRADHVARLRNERGLVPLLDGLDELPPAQQEACVRAVNQFQQTHRPPHLVVCCRLAEYENLSVKLQLNGAIRLLPLRDAQIHAYLERAGRLHLWESISADPESVDLARSPLMLGLMTSIHDETRAHWEDSLGRPGRAKGAVVRCVHPEVDAGRGLSRRVFADADDTLAGRPGGNAGDARAIRASDRTNAAGLAAVEVSALALSCRRRAADQCRRRVCLGAAGATDGSVAQRGHRT